MPRTFTGEQRRELARKGMAMPDGGYPIRNVRDLKNAIQAYGRGNNPEAVKKWIKKRAKELGAEEMLPESWEIEHSDDELMHYGIKGMKWGVRRYQRKDGSLTKAGKNRYTKRQEAVKKYRKASVFQKNEREELKRMIDDLEKNGIKSETFRTMLGKDADFEGPNPSYDGKNRQQILESIIKSMKRSLTYMKLEETKLNEMANRLEKADISERTFLEKAQSSSNRGKAIAAIASIGGVAYQGLNVLVGERTLGSAIARSVGWVGVSSLIGASTVNSPDFYYNRELSQ